MGKTVKEIRALFERAEDEKEIARIIDAFASDERKGVQTLIEKEKKKQVRIQKERERLYEMTLFERTYADYNAICGIDEVGRGPLAGPVAAGAVILPKGLIIPGINDSKKLSAKKREMLTEIIEREAVAFSVGLVSPERIDEINILNATHEAMRKAVETLNVPADMLLVDAETIPGTVLPQKAIIKGDMKSVSIAAASIVAKVYRDHLMDVYDALYPEYNFKQNKGYGSAEHIAAIKKYGPCPIHRRSFIKNFI